jgi:hypothetical protein
VCSLIASLPPENGGVGREERWLGAILQALRLACFGWWYVEWGLQRDTINSRGEVGKTKTKTSKPHSRHQEATTPRQLRLLFAGDGELCRDTTLSDNDPRQAGTMCWFCLTPLPFQTAELLPRAYQLLEQVTSNRCLEPFQKLCQ